MITRLKPGMNIDIVTFSFTYEESRLLQALVSGSLPADIHSVNTSYMEPVPKTRLLVTITENYRQLMNLLEWDPNRDYVRAYRQINVEAIHLLRGLLTAVKEDQIPKNVMPTFKALGLSILRNIQQSLTTVADKPFLQFHHSLLENPKAKA